MEVSDLIWFARFAALFMIAAGWTAGFVFFRTRGNTFAEAGAYAGAAVLMGFSFLLQIGRLAGFDGGGALLVVLSVSAAGMWVLKKRKTLAGGFSQAVALVIENPLPGSLIVLLFGLLVMRFSLVNQTIVDTLGISENQAILLSLIPAAEGVERGAFPLLSYASIGFAVYALSRRYAWPPTALVSAILVWTMPRLILHSTVFSGEIMNAAIAVFCLLALYRVVEQPDFFDLAMMITGVSFGASQAVMDLAFACIFLMLSYIVIVRRHGHLVWRFVTAGKGKIMPVAILPALVFSHIPAILIHRARFGDWRLPTHFVETVFNPDGVLGAVANFFRYMLEMIHFIEPLDRLVGWLFGMHPVGLLEAIHHTLLPPFLAGKGAVTSFSISWATTPFGSWFGPFAFLLIFPGFLYALRRGPRRLKALCIALAGYIYLIALIPAWSPGNARYFTTFFVCSGCCSAFFLPPWRFSRTGRRVLLICCALLMLYVCLPAGMLAGWGLIEW